MAQLVLRSATLHFGPKLILDKVNLTLDKGERISLVGRNGVGKTTLFRVLLGQTDLDGGEMITESGLKMCALPQDVPMDIAGKVFDIVESGLTHEDDEDEWQSKYKVDTVLSVLELEGGRQFSDLSGGLKRRVLLARALVTEPDILLLDEPTNHLDIAAVEWLEHFLKSYEGCVLFITHDRRFLQNTARRIIELDRGEIQSFEGTYDKFLAHKAAQNLAEDRQNAEFDKKLAKEEAWIRQGVKARRTRNEGRVRALHKLREEFAARKKRTSQADMISAGGDQSGRKVIEAYNISVEFEGKKLIDKFSTLIMRGDKIGILGPNGCGKSTLINALLGKLPISEGTIKYGTELQIAYFDQMRGQLNDEKSVIDNIAEGSEFVDIAGKQVHIYSYLSRYLFAPDRAREKVKVLSGGERNRCLLAKIMSRPSNLLILDEPTNDLDMDSIELLEELLVDYKGTLVLVSHDRAFLDNVVASTIAFDHDGTLNQYVGGYEDWLRQRPVLPGEVKKVSKKDKQAAKPKAEVKSKSKLSFTQRNELDRLPGEIDAKEKEINQMHKVIGQPGFYEQSQDTITKATEKLAQFEAEHEALFARWEELSELE